MKIASVPVEVRDLGFIFPPLLASVKTWAVTEDWSSRWQSPGDSQGRGREVVRDLQVSLHGWVGWVWEGLRVAVGSG